MGESQSVARRFVWAAIWVVVVLEAVLMGLAGSAKFTGPEQWASYFAEWGYPPGFSYVVGGAELLFAAGLLIPRFSAYAAIVLIGIMLAALATVVIHDSPLGVVGPLVNLGALGVIALGRWGDRWRPQSTLAP